MRIIATTSAACGFYSRAVIFNQVKANPKANEFEFEALEPRLLLSADGLMAAAGGSLLEHDPAVAEGAPVVVAYGIADDSAGASADESAQGDDIFDVTGQVMEQSVEPTGTLEERWVQGSVEPATGTETGASGTEPVVMASVYDGGSAMTQQLVETLNASNAPPSEVDGDTLVSTHSSLSDSDESGALHTQALSVLPGDSSNTPVIQAEVDTVVSGANGAFEDGFAALYQAIADLLNEDPLFQSYVPGFLTTIVRGNDTVVISPTLGQALAISSDVWPSAKLDSGFGNGLSGNGSGLSALHTNSLIDRFLFVTEFIPATFNFFPGNYQAELALDAMDIDTDGTVSAAEAIAVMVLGQISHFTADYSYGDVSELAAEFATDLNDDFEVPDFLSAFYLQITFTAVSTLHGEDFLLSLNSLSLTMNLLQQVDLGYLADELKIGLNPGVPPDPGEPKQLVVVRTLSFDSLAIGLSGAADGGVGAGDFFFSAPSGIEVGLDMSGNVDDMEINVGFLGTKVTDGTGFKLDMHATGFASDPTNPGILGFGGTPIIDASGSLTLPNAPTSPALEHDVQFSIGVGSQSYSPFKEITVTAAETSSFTTVDELKDLIQTKVNAAFGSGFITVGKDGSDRLTFTLVSTTPDVAGILSELSGEDLGGGFALIVADSKSSYVKTDPNPFSVPAFTFLLSVNGSDAALVSVASFDATLVDPDNTPANGDEYYEVTATDLANAIQTAVNATSLAAVSVFVAGDKIEFSKAGAGATLEITKTLVFDTVEKITIDELAEYGAEIFEFTADPNAEFVVDLELTALPGIELPGSTTDYIPVGTISVNITDPFNQAPDGTEPYSIVPVLVGKVPTTGEDVIKVKFDLTFGGQMDEMLDFNVLGPSEMLGIINQIAVWLERAVGTQLFTAFDLPFAQASLAEILFFGDMVRDAFLISDGDDGVAKPNASNDDVDDKARLLSWIPTDTSLTDFRLVAMFTNAQQFERRLGKIVYLILSEISPGTFDAAENAIINLVMDNVDATYDATEKELTFNMSTNHSLPPEYTAAPTLQPEGQTDGVQVPMDFLLDLDPLGEFVTESMLFLTGEGRFDFTLGVKLGDAATPLDTGSFLLSDFNDGRGVQVNTNLALTSLIDIEQIVGRLSSDAVFSLTLVTNSDSDSYSVKVLRNEQTIGSHPDFGRPFTSDNSTFQDLLDDINNALKRAGATDDGTPTGNLLVEAVAEWAGTGARDTGRIVFRPTAAGAAIIAMRISTSSGNSAYFELGLPPQSASTAHLIAPNSLAGAIPGEDLSFDVIIQRGGSAEAPVTVSVRQTPGGGNESWTDNNSTLTDLVNDINAAIKAAGLDDDIVAGRSGNTLALFAINSSVRGFSIVAAGNTPAKLGLDDAAAEEDLDFIGVDTANVANALSTGVMLRAQDTISNPFGRLGVSLDFNINGTQVLLDASATATNSSITDLVRDLNNALDGINDLKGKIIATYDGINLVLKALDPSIASITVTNLSADEEAQIGFSNNATADSALRIIANRLAPVSFGVTAPTTFTVSVDRPGVADDLAWTATLSDQVTITNRNLFDLAADLNQSMNAGFIAEYYDDDPSITADDNPLIAVVQGDRIVIGLKTVKGGSALVSDPSKAAEDVIGFAITAPGGSTLATELGLVPTGAGNQLNSATTADFFIYFSDGTYGRVSLDSLVDSGNPDDVLRFKLDDLKTIQQLFNEILNSPRFNADGTANGLVSAKLTIGLRSDGSGIVLTEKTFVAVPGNPDAFRVVAVNGSPAALQLGILASDTTQLDVGQYDAVEAGKPDGSIEGARIATLDIIDRVFLQDPVLDAVVQVTTDGVATAEGNFGFVGIRVSSTDDQLLYEVDVNVPFITDGDNRVNLDELFSALNRVSNLWDLVGLPEVTGGSQTDFTFGVEIWPVSDVVDDLFTLPGTASITFDFVSFGQLQKYIGVGSIVQNSVRLIATDPNNPTDNLVEISHNDFGALANFETLLLDDVLDALEKFIGFLGEFAGFGFLEQEIPLLGESINALLDVANRFAAAIQTVRLNPAGGLQSLSQALRQGFGLPEFANDTERDAYFAARGIPDPTALIAFDLLDLNGTDDLLRFDLRIPVSFVQSRSVDLDLGAVDFLGGSEIVDLQGGAGLSVVGYLDTHISFGIDLSTPSNVYLFDNATGLFGGIKAKADNLVFNAAIGPMGVFIRDGSAEISVEFGMDNGAFDPDSESRILIGNILDLVDGDGGAEYGPKFLGEIKATLPVFFPDDSTYIGDIVLDISQANGNALVLNSPTFTPPDLTDPNTLTLPDFSFIDLSQLSPFNSLPLLLDTLDFFLAGLQDILDGEVFGLTLPLIGDKLSSGADFIENIRRNILEPIRQFVEQAPEAGEELIEALLEALLGDGSDGIMFGGIPLQQFLGLTNPIPGLGLLSSPVDTVALPDDEGYVWNVLLGDLYSPPVEIAFDLGFPALGLSMDSGLVIEITWQLALGLGISRSDGAFILMGGHGIGPTGDEELVIEVDISLPEGSNIEGRLGFLQLIAEDNDTFFHADFTVDVFNGNHPSDPRLSFSELGLIDIKVGMSAAALVDLDLTLQFNEAILPDTISALLPKLKAGFILDWDTGNIFSDEFDFASSLKFIGFTDVKLDMGSFLSDFLGPIVNKIAEITKPLQPVIDVFTARIPVLSDLAGRTVTLLDIAGLFGEVDTGMIYAIADIITLVNQIAGVSNDAELLVPLGDFTLFDSENPVAGFENFAQNLTLPTFNLGGGSEDSDFDFDSFVTATSQQVSDFAGKLNGSSGDSGAKSISQSLVNKTAPGAGDFIFPLFENPTLAFGLLLGRDVSLVEYDLPPFGVDFTYVQKFPIWGPLFARITGSVGLTIDLAFGYDTYGVRKFAQGNFSNPLDLLAGFYVNDTDQPGGVGTDVPELILRGELFAGAEINLGIASAGVEGGIILTINFDLYDPDSDGKVRIKELVGNFLYEFKYGNPAVAPIAIFDVFGDVAVQLRAFIEFLFFEKTFEITPPITIVEFSIEFDREPILATERGDGSLVLNIGANSAARLNGDTRDIGEEIYVKSVSSSEVLVWSPKFNVDESAAQSYHIGNNKQIIVYGGAGNDTINLAGLGHGITYVVDAGAGDDTVVGGQAGGEMDGGLGNDTLTGGDGRDVIIGGLGNDTIEGGGDDDWLFGDNGSVSEFVLEGVNMIRFRALSTADDGDDRINGGAGNDIVFGGGGYDLIFGGADNDLLLGDGGYFEGPASSGGIPTVNGFVDITRIVARGLGANDRVFGGSGGDTILGGPGNDLLDGGSDSDVVLGGTGNDTIYGGAGGDRLFGDENDDTIFGYRDPYGPADFGLDPDDPANSILPTADLGDYIEGGDGNDFIRGQGGDDRIHGNRGADIIFGDEGNDNIGAGFVDRPWIAGPDKPYNSEAGGDIVFGGAGNDTVNAGTGADIVFGDDGLVVFLFFPDTTGLLAFNQLGSRIRTDAGSDHKLIGDGDETVLIKAGDLSRHDGLGTTPDLYATEPLATDGDDYIAGGDGNDIVFGGGGDDEVYGDFDPTQAVSGPRPFGQDALLGDGGRVEIYGRRYQAIEAVGNQSYDGIDTISGNDGGDFIFGGGNEDLIFGFQNPAQGGQTPLPAVSENDSIFGDNGRIEFDPSDRFNRITRMFTTYAGVGLDSGKSDVIHGQWGSDVIFGGLNSSSDVLNGGLGDDIVIGDQGEVLFYAPGLGDGWEKFAGDNFPTFDPNFLGREFWDESFPLFLVRSYPDNVGGIDIVSGNQGDDILIGGTAGDFIYGDDPTGSSLGADGEDIALGDNGEVWFNIDFEEPDFDDDLNPIGVPNTSIGRLTAQVAAMPFASAIDRIRTTDTAENTGGADIMAGSAGADIMFGGVNAGSVDLLYGDRQSPAAGSLALDRDDILVGDNGVVDFAFGGDTDRLTLDLIRSYEDTRGGTDIISGDAGSDVGIGGTGGDVIYGDRATPNATSLAADGNDTLIGDNADIFLVDAEGAAGGDTKLVLGAAVSLIRTTDQNFDPNVAALNTGGVDTISGNAKSDIIAGGVAGDYLYGDGVQVVFTTPSFADPILGIWTIVSRLAVKSGADGADIVLGDNGALEWLSTGRFNEITGINIAFENPALSSNEGQGWPDTDLTTLDLVTTEQPNNGGRDWIWGGDGNDALFGGTDSDTMFGDNGFDAMGGVGTEDTSGADDGGDMMFGDHGRIYPQFSTMWNGSGDWRDSLHSRNFFAIDIEATDGGDGDRMWGQAGDDNMLGQQGDDRMWGGHHDDDMIGGHNVRGGWDELGGAGVIAISITSNGDTEDFNDLMDGDGGNDVMAGDNAIIWRRGDSFDPRFRSLTATSIYTTGPDTIITNVDPVGKTNPSGADGRDVTLVDHDFTIQGSAQGRFGRDIMAGGTGGTGGAMEDGDRMFGQLGDDLMQGDGSVDLAATVAPYLWWPVEAAGLPDDMNAGAPEVSDKYVDLFFNIPELLTDGKDYLEGNGGSDLLFGGLGQDDLIGGSSELYGLDTWAKRPDSSDIMFGGAGIRTGREDFGGALGGITFATKSADNVITTTPDGHSLDADFMMGDNANVYRMVNSTGTAFLQFNYDQTWLPYEDRGTVRIIPRAMEQLDYHLGGADYNGGTYNADGQAEVTDADLDNGAADFMHGEAGDDFMFGMTGSDLMFGGPQDDDMIGGYGNDWMSGGTGQDGMLGDDGLILTSRNSTLGEPLNGVAGLRDQDPSAKYSHGDVLDELISTPGDLQIAVINPTGALKKAADLVPFSYDPAWTFGDDIEPMDDEFPDDDTNTPFADDLIFGGLGSDFLHGGSGDDGISGAEALNEAWVVTFDPLEPFLGLGYSQVGLPSLNGPWVFLGIATYGKMNPGDALAFNPIDLDGQHLNNRFRAGEFWYYDEYDPRRKILLTAELVDGSWVPSLYKGNNPVGDGALEFVLNFNEAEGIVRPADVVPKAVGQQTPNYPQVNDDGKDAIFGDNGNDWLVGGTGRDNIYGGWGNDLLNADDDHDGHNKNYNGNPVPESDDNNVPDTHPTYEDRAYGGAGRDILIGNTGGDRLIDWVGEYNSYLVPYAPFGQASVSRTLQPFLPEFLYALSAGDGADFSRYGDQNAGAPPPSPTNNNPNPSRNGEPGGELGLVLQKDFAWQDQTGAPADPQAGNIPGGHRDVLRSAGFNDGQSDGFFIDSGKWTVKSGVYTVEPTLKGGDALSVFYVDDFIPSYFEVLATLNPLKPTGGYKANAYIIFDYQSETDFKFAGVDVSTNKLVIGHRADWGWAIDVQASVQGSLKAGTNYNIFVSVNGNAVTVILDNKITASHVFAPRLDVDGSPLPISHGMVGLGADNAKASIDNMIVQRLAPVMTYMRDVDFSSGLGDLFEEPSAGIWSLATGRYDGAAAGAVPAINLFAPDPAPSAIIDLSTVLATTGAGGFVFDYYNATSFKYAAVDRVAGTVTVGHRTAKGWFTDAVYTNAAIKTSSDQSLGITLKGSTVSVKWNNSLVISFVFNALVTDGSTGLLGRSGTTSFNSVKFQSDDPTLQTATTSAPVVNKDGLTTWTSYSTLSAQDLLEPVPAGTTATTLAPSGTVSVLNDMAGGTRQGPSESGEAAGFRTLATLAPTGTAPSNVTAAGPSSTVVPSSHVLSSRLAGSLAGFGIPAWSLTGTLGTGVSIDSGGGLSLSRYSMGSGFISTTWTSEPLFTPGSPGRIFDSHLIDDEDDGFIGRLDETDL